MRTTQLRVRVGSLVFVAIAIVALAHGAASIAQSPAKSPASDWPVFRGNTLQTGVATSELPGELEILWRFQTKNAVEATAAIVGDTVFVGSFDEHLYALNLADGSLRWKHKHKDSSAFRVGPGVNGGNVYAGDEFGKFFCLDAATGEQRWLFDTEAEITSAPNFDGDRVLFGCGDQLLYCLDKNKGGKPLWTFKVPGGPVMGSPAIINNRTFVAGCDSAMHVIDTTTGKEVADVELDGQVGATPALVGEFLYVGTMGRQVQAINWKEAKVVWSYEAAKRAQDYYASVAATDDLILAGSRDRCLHAIDRKTGVGKWVFPTNGKVDSSPVVAGNRVYFGSTDGNLYVVDLKTGKEVQKIELGREILASPAVSGGRLVIGTTEGTVYCLGKR